MMEFNKEHLGRRVVPGTKADGREIELFVRKSKNLDRVTLAQAQSIGAVVVDHDLEKIKLTELQIQHLAMGLGVEANELIDRYALEEEHGLDIASDFDGESSLTFLANNLHLMRTPIAKRGKSFIQINVPLDLSKLQIKQ
ncbi:MAG: hypothetical protein WD048_15790 [Chitinophagales bacterium]